MSSEVLSMFAKMFLVITTLFTVILYFLAVVLEPALFYFTPEGLNASMLHLSVLPFWFLNMTVGIPIGLDLGVVFFGLWAVFTLSFVAAWKLNKNFHTTIKEAITKPARALFSNCLFAMPVMNSMTLIVVILISSIQEAGGIPTGTSPIQDGPFLSLFELSYSSIAEEIGFRVLPIGIFLLLSLIIIAQKKEVKFSLKQKTTFFFSAILFPDKAKKMVNTKTVHEHGILKGISGGEWGMLVFTALVFGLAHFNPGISWEIGKVSSATVAGLVLGFSYLVYGAHAAVIMHWFFNVYTDTFFLLSDVYPIAEPLANVVAIFSLILGIIGWAYVSFLGYCKLARSFQEKTSQIEATPNPPESL